MQPPEIAAAARAKRAAKNEADDAEMRRLWERQPNLPRVAAAVGRSQSYTRARLKAMGLAATVPGHSTTAVPQPPKPAPGTAFERERQASRRRGLNPERAAPQRREAYDPERHGLLAWPTEQWGEHHGHVCRPSTLQHRDWQRSRRTEGRST